ncbi:MAG: DNA methyltransferase [Acidimicrobiia bacterium]
MADELDALLGRVHDDGLRAELRDQIDRLRRRRQFGLVFESHLPERVRLPDHPIRRGSKVVRREAPAKETSQEVLRVQGRTVVLNTDGESEEVDRDEVVVVAEFGEPIYPGLRRLSSIDRGGDKPSHIVIKGENYHALEALRFSHAGKIDCIYIDPPYNSGARDWKYDNDYVDADDGYRHSKWLAFMERRLRLAKDLLNPEASVLIVTIDEKEYLRLGLLLTQTFPDATSQMVSTVINPAGTGRQNEFSRTNEYIFVLILGSATIQPMLAEDTSMRPVTWETFRRRDLTSRRGTAKGGPAQFYPIYVDLKSGRIVGVGEPLSHDQDRATTPDRPGCETVFPVRDDGTEMNWGLSRNEFERRLAKGYVHVGRHTPSKPQKYVLTYLRSGPISDIEQGRAVVTGRQGDGAMIAHYPEGKKKMPTTQWELPSHDAQRYGTNLLQSLIPGRRFPFPKSLYAVEDVLRIAVGDLPDAVILDFFAGSSTTTHAVARLNRQDEGRRTSIVITNNEVSADEAASLRAAGYLPGDDEWEVLGIFEQIARPRVTAALTGVTPDGQQVKGEYKFTDEFPISEGFEENVEFLELKYLDVEDVELELAFESVAPLLWLRAGGSGPVIDQRCDESGAPKPFDLVDRYGVLFNPDHWRAFVERLPETVTTVFVVTDSPSVFASVTAELPSGVDVLRLYENYLSTFAINRGR